MPHLCSHRSAPTVTLWLASALLLLLLLGSSASAGAQPTVIAAIAVGDCPVGVAVHPSANRIYVTNWLSDDVSVVDGATNSVIDTIAVGDGPWDVAANPSTSRIYVANMLGKSVSVIDGTTNAVIRTIPVPGSPWGGVGVNPSTNRVYVGDIDNDNVLIIDGLSNEVMETVPVGDNPAGLAVNPVTNRVYVGNAASEDVSVIDGATNTVIATVAVDAWPGAVAVNPNTNRIYMANFLSSNVSVLDGATNTVIQTIPVGGYPAGVRVNPSNDRVYVANGDDDNVSVIDGATNTVVDTVPVGRAPVGVGVNPSTNRIYVANSSDDNVSVIEGIVGPMPDTDGDGIPDAEDACPNDPEDFDGFEDDDGCPEGDFSFAIITDLHIGREDYLENRLQRVVEWLNQNWCAVWVDSQCVMRNFDFVAVLGDISENGDRQQLEDAKAILERLDPRLPYVPLIGNHDVYGSKKAASAGNFHSVFAKEFNELCLHPGFSDCDDDGAGPLYLQNFSFVYRGAKFVGLDFVTRATVAAPAVHSATLDWLKAELGEHSGKATPVVFLAHHPLLILYEHMPWCSFRVWPGARACFVQSEIDAIRSAIDAGRRGRESEMEVVTFGGHVHGFSRFELGKVSKQMPIFDANHVDEKPSVGVPVVITEALMVGSNQRVQVEPEEWKDFVRIVRVGNQDVEYGDMEGAFLPALNPDFEWSLPRPELGLCERGPWWLRIQVPCVEGWRLDVSPDPYSEREYSRCEWDFTGDREPDASECNASYIYPDRQERTVCLTLTSKDDATVVETECRRVWGWVP